MTRGSQAPREEVLDRGVERAGDPQRAADGDSEAAFRALYCAAAHCGARGELGACKVLLEAEQGNRVVHAPHTTQIGARRKVIIFYLFSCVPFGDGLSPLGTGMDPGAEERPCTTTTRW